MPTASSMPSSHADGDAPDFVRVHIEKGGTAIPGSPFAMTCGSGDYAAGVNCSYTQAGLAAGTDYSYSFVAEDSQGAAAMPTEEVDAPDVTAEQKRFVFMPLVLRDMCTFPTFSDDFGDPSSGWSSGDDERRTFGYLGGEYQIKLKSADDSWKVTPDLLLPADYRVEVEVHRAFSDPGTHGIVFGVRWDQNTYEAYQFVILAETQEYLLEKRMMDGSWPLLIDWTYNPAIRSGSATNHLRVDRVGTKIHMYINGSQVATYYDDSFTGPGRDAGLSVYSTDVAGTDARFDNFRALCVP
ncbi:hypothetical protein ACFLYD_09215 [Chloroflexota bacterium]